MVVYQVKRKNCIFWLTSLWIFFLFCFQLCQNFNVTMILSRPYHPKAQEKIERSYRELRNKIHYDIVKWKNKGVNWVKNLTNYMRILKELAQDLRGWKSPLEVYYGRQSNVLQKLHIQMIKPSVGCLLRMNPWVLKTWKTFQWIKKVQEETEENTNRLDKTMFDKHKRRYKTVDYKRDDNVLVPIGYGGKKSNPKRRFVAEGTIFMKNKHSELGVSIKDLTSTTNANRINACDRSHRSKILHSYSVEVWLQSFKDQSYSIY